MYFQDGKPTREGFTLLTEIILEVQDNHEVMQYDGETATDKAQRLELFEWLQQQLTRGME